MLAYLIPGEQLDRLRAEAGFDGLLAGRPVDRLRHAVAASAAEARTDLLSVRGDELATRPLVTSTDLRNRVLAAGRSLDTRWAR